MKCTPKISVIITVYNEEEYLLECLESVMNQSLQEIEVICIDDGSTDRSIEILRKFQNMDDHFCVIQQQNQFAGCARNKGLQIAKGEYLLFLDADDIFEKDMFEKLYDKAETSEADIVICENSVINAIEYSFEKERSLLPEEEVFSADMLDGAAIFQVTTGVAWNKLFRKKYIDELNISFQNLRCSNDGFFVYAALMSARRIAYIREKLIKYRLGNILSLSGSREKTWINAFEMLQAIKQYMLDKNIYFKYEKSFMNYALTHSIGYLNSIHSKEALVQCYTYMQINEKECFHLLDKTEDFYYRQDCIACYKNICEKPFDEFINAKNATYDFISPVIRFWGNQYKEGSSLAIYGAGRIGKLLYSRLNDSNKFNKIELFDKKYMDIKESGFFVENPEKIKSQRFDYIYIAIKNEGVVNAVLEWINSWKNSQTIVYHL